MLARLRSLWRNLRHTDRVDRDLDQEVHAVFDLLVDEKVAGGLTPEQARRAATLELGRVHSVTQQVREQRTGATLDAVIKDVRYGLRMLRANPGFTAVVVLSLAIGIGANSAVFSVANVLMLRTLNVPQPEELFAPRRAGEAGESLFSYPAFAQLRDAVPNVGIAAMSRVMRVQARSGAEASAASLQLVSGEFFNVLHVATAQGRLFTGDDNRTVGGHPVAVVSDAFWQRRLGGAPDVVGREITINGARVNIIGVAPRGFTGVWLELPVDVWMPLAMQAEVRYIGNMSASNADLDQPWMPQERVRWLDLIARAGRADGAEAAALKVAFGPIAQREAAEDDDNPGTAASLILAPYSSGASGLRTRFRTPLFALMAMVGLLLLIACVNTANLLLARAAARQREMAVRLSIGASRARIMFQMLIESTILGVLAAGVGLMLAPFAAELLIRMTLGVQSGPAPIGASLDGRVLLFTGAITFATSLLCGVLPAWRATDVGVAETLKSQGRGTHGGGPRLHVARLLVGAQVSLSLLLVVAAGLFLRSLDNLSSTPLGFDPSRIVSASINPRFGGYQPADLPELYRRVLARVEAMPGVQSAALAVHGVMTSGRSIGDGYAMSGYDQRPGEVIRLQLNRVTPNYLRTIGIQILAGRDFTDRDIGAPVAIINEALARRYFDGRDPVGQRILQDEASTEIIGVARDSRINSVREAAEPLAFMPIETAPGYLGALQVRTVGDPAGVSAALTRAIQEIELGLPVDRVTAVSAMVTGTYRQEQLIARLTALLGALALGLACLGLYGLMAYAVKRRTSEIGLRFALGAKRGNVLWMVLRESLVLVAFGLAAGLPIVFVTSRLIGGLLFDVPPNDPATIIMATLLLLVVAALSSYLPARRASRVEPLVALRAE